MDGFDGPRDANASALFDNFTGLGTRTRIDVRHPRLASLFRLVESEVIPRLIESHRRGPLVSEPTAAHVETLTRLSLARESAGAWAQVVALRDAGVGPQALLEQLIAPAARRLGEMWVSDTVDFTDVALACGRLSAAVRRLGAESAALPAANAPRALVATLEKERHTLGPAIFAQGLRAEGWSVCEAIGSVDSLGAVAVESGFAFIGLSFADNRDSAATAAALRALRLAAKSKPCAFALGGAAVRETPWLAEELGADFFAVDACSAAQAARALLSRMS